MRVILEAVVAVLVITLLRSVLGVILKGFSELLHPSGGAASGSPEVRTPPRPVSGELKKDPVCGTFIAASSSLQKTFGGETYYFCSAACRDQFRGPGVRKAV
ncbi:MAG TPA: YHS domain-containing protein [Bryobacteraceae bacterium]|nr:YHS domain-containing protein [Bryobacteraceae bacterium]